jgi:hypothetical protein
LPELFRGPRRRFRVLGQLIGLKQAAQLPDKDRRPRRQVVVEKMGMGFLHEHGGTDHPFCDDQRRGHQRLRA